MNTPEGKKELLSKVMATPMKENNLTDDQKKQKIEEHFKGIMETLGLDLEDDSLKETPRRLAKMYIDEIFEGLDPLKFPKMTTIENKMQCNQMVSVSGIRFLSVCEHHFATIDGFATIAYIPNKKVIGLSKLNRITKYFARRPQVQERLTTQIADALVHILGTDNVAVHIKAKHYCVISRGVEDTESMTTTTDVRGIFKTDHSARSEFLRTTK